MKTLLLEIDASIYAQVLGFLRVLPEKHCHIIETSQNLVGEPKPEDISSAFGLIKTSITTSLAEIKLAYIAGAIDD